MRARFFVLALAATVAAAPAVLAQAPEAPDLAELRARANQAMIDLRTEEALTLYKQIHTASKDPSLLYNMARAEQALGRHAEALDHLEAFEREASPELRARVPKLAELLAELRGKVTALSVTADVPDARVLVGGVDVGKAPLRVRVNAGPQTLEVTAPGRHPHKRTVTLPGGGAFELQAALFPIETTGFLTVTSRVAGAEVVVDGKRVGQVPVEMLLPEGPHRLVVRREGHHPSDTTVQITAGQKREVAIDLAKTTPVTKTWWFWTGVGAVVVTGVAVTAALLTERSADKGTIGNGQIAAPLVRFK